MLCTFALTEKGDAIYKVVGHFNNFQTQVYAGFGTDVFYGILKVEQV